MKIIRFAVQHADVACNSSSREFESTSGQSLCKVLATASEQAAWQVMGNVRFSIVVIR